MNELQKRYINVMCESGMLQFGDFVTKAGRNSPYFINSGHICSGRHIAEISHIYGQHIQASFGDQFTHLFGPAYKGIPLATMAAQGLHQLGHGEYTVTYNRKELKDHGEGGNLVGYKLSAKDSVLVVEDVISRGTSIHETMKILKHSGAEVKGVVVGVDRQERGFKEMLAADELEHEYSIVCSAIVNVDEIVHYLSGEDAPAEFRLNEKVIRSIDHYRENWGR